MPLDSEDDRCVCKVQGLDFSDFSDSGDNETEPKQSGLETLRAERNLYRLTFEWDWSLNLTERNSVGHDESSQLF